MPSSLNFTYQSEGQKELQTSPAKQNKTQQEHKKGKGKKRAVVQSQTLDNNKTITI
jgi:hypothetical protein